MFGHNNKIYSPPIKNFVKNLFELMAYESVSFLKIEAIKMIITGKKKDIGKTILSGNLKKMVIAITNKKENINDRADIAINLTALFCSFRLRKNNEKNNIMKSDEYIIL
jgi:hypothetical protein